MLAVTNSTFDLLVLQLFLQTALLALLLDLLGLSLPVHAGAEYNVLSDGGGIERRTWRMTLLQAEFGPSSSLSYAGVDVLFDDCCADATGGLDFLAVVVEAV